MKLTAFFLSSSVESFLMPIDGNSAAQSALQQQEQLSFISNILQPLQAGPPQFSQNENSCLEWTTGSCPDFDSCLVQSLNMQKVRTILDNGNFITSKYEVGCADGYSPNMEGMFQTSIVECKINQDDPTLVGWSFSSSFDCIKSSVGGFNTKSGSPPCNLAGITWYHTENFIRGDRTSTATWPLLMDSNGAFIRTRVPLDRLTDKSGYENGFIILVVYNLKLSDFANAGETIRFTMYGQDFKHVATEEDAESTVVAFQSQTPHNLDTLTSINLYFSIEGVNMDATQHVSYEIGTIGGSLYTQESYVSDLATCILPLIDGTPADNP